MKVQLASAPLMPGGGEGGDRNPLGWCERAWFGRPISELAGDEGPDASREGCGPLR